MPKIGDRVEIPPHMDSWTRGDRYGLVVVINWSLKSPARIARVLLDKSGKVVRVPVENLTVIER